MNTQEYIQQLLYNTKQADCREDFLKIAKDHSKMKFAPSFFMCYPEADNFYNSKRAYRTLKNLTPCQMEDNFIANTK